MRLFFFLTALGTCGILHGPDTRVWMMFLTTEKAKSVEYIMEGTVRECIEHFKKAAFVGDKRTTAAEFIGLPPESPSARRWFENGMLRNAEDQIRLVCYLDFIGYGVSELRKLREPIQQCAKLIAFRVMDLDNMVKLLGLPTEGSGKSMLLPILMGRRASPPELQEKMKEVATRFGDMLVLRQGLVPKLAYNGAAAEATAVTVGHRVSEERRAPPASEHRDARPILRAATEKCFAHFVGADFEGDKEAALKDFFKGSVRPSMLSMWLTSQSFPRGKNLVQLRFFLDAVGYKVIELEDLNPVVRSCAELYALGALSIEEVAEALRAKNGVPPKVSHIFSIFHGENGVSRKRLEGLQALIELYQDRLSNLRAPIPLKYRGPVKKDAAQETEAEHPPLKPADPKLVERELPAALAHIAYGTDKRCFRHFVKAEFEGDKAEALAAFVEPSIEATIVRGLLNFEFFPQGMLLVKLRFFLDFVGYKVVEVEKLPVEVRDCARLYAFGAASMDALITGLDMAGSGAAQIKLTSMFLGTLEPSSAKVPKMKEFAEEFRSLYVEKASAMPRLVYRGTAVLAADPEERQSPNLGVSIAPPFEFRDRGIFLHSFAGWVNAMIPFAEYLLEHGTPEDRELLLERTRPNNILRLSKHLVMLGQEPKKK